ncbi:MAG: shikimate dehydrogenase [bacterium]
MKYAFMLHLMKPKDLAEVSPIINYIPDKVLEAWLRRTSPKKLSYIRGVQAKTGETDEGWFVLCPLTAKQIMGGLPEEEVIQKIVDTANFAKDLGAEVIGLGALTAIPGNKGIEIAKRVDMTVTTGNTYTAVTALKAAENAAELLDINLKNATVSVVGATGSIGGVCARVMAKDFSKVNIVGRNQERLEKLGEQMKEDTEVEIFTDVSKGIKDADIVITVTSAIDSVIDANAIKSGAVVCDVARPRDVAKEVAQKRNDVLIIEGGVIKVPGKMDTGGYRFGGGLPEGRAYACMSETMMLGLANKKENFSLGPDLDLDKAEEIWELGQKFGFEIDGFRSFEKLLTEEQIESVKKNIKK